MFDNFWLRRRYGKKLDVKNLSDLQKIFLFDKRVKDNIDSLGNKTVSLLENKIKGINLSLIDKYCYNYHGDRKNKGDYALERSRVYKEIFNKFPEYIGSFENRYRLSDDTLVSITFDVERNV